MKEPTFVAFVPKEEGFIASVPMEQLDALGSNPEAILEQAGSKYQSAISDMRSLLAELDSLKAKRTPIPASKVWELGDAVLALLNDLERSSMELDNLYEHLARDLGMNEKRLGTVITFRRHLSDKELIPESLKWSQCEKNARKVAENLSKGQREAQGALL